MEAEDLETLELVQRNAAFAASRLALAAEQLVLTISPPDKRITCPTCGSRLAGCTNDALCPACGAKR